MAKIVFIGDSITLGVGYGGVTTANRFSTLIGVSAGYAPEDIINVGVGGNNSLDVLTRLQSDVISQSPAVCVVMIGNNDFSGAGKTLSTTQYASNITSIVEQLRAASIKVVLFSPMLTTGSTASFVSWNAYLKAIEDVVGQLKVPYVDIFREFSYASLRGEFSGLHADAVHPSAAGHAFIAEYATRPKHSGFFMADPITPPSEQEPELPRGVSSEDFDKVRVLSVALGELAVKTLNNELTNSVQVALTSVYPIGQNS